MRKSGALKAIAKLLSESSDEELKSLCCVAGRAFVRGPHSKNQTEFRKLNVIPVCVQMLFVKNESLVSYVSGFLLDLCRDHQKNQETLVYAGE